MPQLAESFGVDPITVSKRLKALGMTQKQCHRMPNQLKLRDIKQKERNRFFHRIMPRNETGILCNNPKRRESGSKPGDALISTTKPIIYSYNVMLRIWMYRLSVVYYELLKWELNHGRSLSTTADASEPSIE